MALTDIEHIVVVMMENRSFDNLLGWLYDNQTNPPKFNIPDQQPPVYEGLKLNAYSNVLNGSVIPVSYPPTAWPPANNANVVPTPDPNEEFVYVTNQLFGTKTPAPGATANMSGFLQDYSTTAAGVAGAGQIMETFGPIEANVINDLAKNFAVCDHWYASVPSQTWPNRAFVHSGSSDGHINNDDYELYNIPTIFNVLENQGKTWGVFHDTTYIPSLTLTQFSPQLLIHTNRFFKYDVFEQLCSAAATAPAPQKLPQYSFVEPRFTPELGFGGTQYPADYHPPHNICRGEQFLAGVYQAVSTSPYRDKILLVITFDEHGGCYDHVPPPTGSAAPNPKPVSNDGSFKFDRFGVRVPTIIVSSYVQPSTVFRASGKTPFDHTSLLATIRDWLSLDADPQNPFLPSPRIQKAPTLGSVLTLDDTNKNTNWPAITANCVVGTDDQSLQTPLSQLQQSLIAGAIRQNSDDPHDPATVAQSTATAKSLKTYADAIQFMHPDLPLTPIKQ